MKYEKLGTTDISVSKICIGGMSFGKDEAHPEVWALDEHETEAMIGHAFDLGGSISLTPPTPMLRAEARR